MSHCTILLRALLHRCNVCSPYISSLPLFRNQQGGFLRPAIELWSSSNLFGLRMFFGLYLCRGLCIFRLGGFFGLRLPFLSSGKKRSAGTGRMMRNKGRENRLYQYTPVHASARFRFIKKRRPCFRWPPSGCMVSGSRQKARTGRTI